VVKPNRILNKAIKAAAETIITPLANTVIIYLFKGKLLKYYKKIYYSYTTKGKQKGLLPPKKLLTSCF